MVSPICLCICMIKCNENKQSWKIGIRVQRLCFLQAAEEKM
ncbi:unnamed protein product [Prunus brigantina]